MCRNTAGAWLEKDYAYARTIDLALVLRKTLMLYFEILDQLKNYRKELHKKIMVLAKKDRYQSVLKILTTNCPYRWIILRAEL